MSVGGHHSSSTSRCHKDRWAGQGRSTSSQSVCLMGIVNNAYKQPGASQVLSCGSALLELVCNKAIRVHTCGCMQQSSQVSGVARPKQRTTNGTLHPCPSCNPVLTTSSITSASACVAASCTAQTYRYSRQYRWHKTCRCQCKCRYVPRCC